MDVQEKFLCYRFYDIKRVFVCRFANLHLTVTTHKRDEDSITKTVRFPCERNTYFRKRTCVCFIQISICANLSFLLHIFQVIRGIIFSSNILEFNIRQCFWLYFWCGREVSDIIKICFISSLRGIWHMAFCLLLWKILVECNKSWQKILIVTLL